MYIDELHTTWTESYRWYDYPLSYSNIGTVPAPGFGWIDIDVTVAVNDWLADPSSNFGLLLRPFGNNHNLDYFVSSDAIGDLASFRPELVLTFTDQNHAPITSGISAIANEDTNNLPVILSAIYTDPDANDTFTFSIDTEGTKGTVTNNLDGTFTYDPNGKFESLGVDESATLVLSVSL